MDNLLVILVIVLLISVIILIGVLAYFGNRFLKMKELEKNNPAVNNQTLEKTKSEDIQIDSPKTHKEITPELLTALRSGKKENVHALYCSDHPEEVSNGKCAISADSYCAHCLTKQGDIRIARKYLDLYLDNEWEEIYMTPSDDKNTELKDRLFKVKKELWDEKSLPVIIQGHYKINIQEDEIEEFIVVLTRNEDKEYIKKELSFLS
jgi:uncharacterized protein YneF (UPF0154 family)